MNTTKVAELNAKSAIAEMASAEHRYLASCAENDGFSLSEIEHSESSDEGFQSWFSLCIQNVTLIFSYSLGYDTDSKLYQPYAQVTGETEGEDDTFETRHSATASVDFAELPDAVTQLGSECGEVRVEAFQWLDGQIPSE